ncbi:gliding motility-associated C-terminal domain-containing protein [Flavobacteriales bacterium]|nr:gliding motility-associated C-terminal domain-containing protein [Flavobacteriales bacterium]
MKNLILSVFFSTGLIISGFSQTQSTSLVKKEIKSISNSNLQEQSLATKKRPKIVKQNLPINNVIANMKLVKNSDKTTNSHRLCDHANGNCDPRNLPLSENGKLLSVDGFEVDFTVPDNTEISSICFTPRPYVTGGTKDASCSYSVPCDNASNRDAAVAPTKYFQVIWHVLQTTAGASSNIDQTRIDDLMAELNADYAPYNMIFCSDPTNFVVDEVNYNHDEDTEEVQLKMAHITNPAQLINIYVVGSMGAGGYARFPYDPMGGTSSTSSGIVMNKGNCNVGTHTLAHEMGHTFGLEHTFSGVDERGECSSCYEKVRNANGSSNTSGAPTINGGPYTDEGDREGDWCSDTNPHDTYAYNCSTSSNSNGGCDSDPWNNAPVNNHMSYSFCSSQFTDQQGRRMHCMTNTYLSSWTSYGGGVCGAQPPVAEFSGTPLYGVGPMVTTFIDLSSPTAIINSWTWKFDLGASGTVTCTGCTGADATFVGQTPPTDVTYTIPGLYSVSLEITSGNGNDSESKVDYVEVINPPSFCDTLNVQWNTPVSTLSQFSFSGAPNNWMTGARSTTLQSAPDDFVAMSERFPSAGAGTVVGGVRITIGNFVDDNANLQFALSIYDDATGAQIGEPDWLATATAGGYLGGTGVYTPANWLPQDASYYTIWIPFTNPVTIPSAFFHVEMLIYPGGENTDRLLLGHSDDGEGETDNSNFVWNINTSTTESYQNDHAVDFDLALIPLLGPWNPLPQIESAIYNSVCDTTYVEITDTVFYTPFSDLASVKYQFSDGQVFTFTPPFSAERTVNTYFTSAGPVGLDIIATSLTCGRIDTLQTSLVYPFQTTPDADFTKDQANPICNTQNITFTGTPLGMSDYTWDFGDGTVMSSGTSTTQAHTYSTPGIYYVSLTTTDESPYAADTLFLEQFEAAIPGTFTLVDQDGGIDNYGIGDWLGGTYDIDANGEFEAVSSSWVDGPAFVANDWMITPAIGPLPADQKLYWEAFASDPGWPDGYEVRLSTTGALPADVGNFSALLFSTAAESTTPTNRSVDLSAYAGQTVYIAFRNNSTDMNIIAIDDILIGTKGLGCSNTDQKLDYVEIIDCSVTLPTADGSANINSGCAPLDVTFTDVTAIGDPATSWLWNFDDGTFSTLQNPPPHTYTATGTYNVIFEACNSGGCSTETIVITVDGIAEDPTYTYNSTIQCQGGTDMEAIITGVLGGGFTSVPAAGISLNATTGFIDVSASTPNTYDVTYTTPGVCANTLIISVTINADQDASFNYASASYCVGGIDPTPTISGTAGGTFTAPLGLSLNPGGLIDLSTSDPGSYFVAYTTAGPCSATSNQAITIIADEDATYTYSSTSECQSGTDMTAAITGTPGGTFTATTASLSLNSTTGLIDVSSSAPNTYDVTYTTPGSCPATFIISITINADEDASFTLSSANECQSGTDATATITGTTGGAFTAAPAGLSINGVTGDIDVSASTAGAYTVTYTTAGACSANSNQAITIVADEDATYTYSSTTECQSGTDMTATITGTAGGTFTSTPAGLTINAGSGLIDVSTSTANAYDVTYTTPGTCSASLIISVTINADEDATFSYLSGTFCVTGADPLATIAGTTGGSFTATGGLTINGATGLIDLGVSGIGSYTVTYATGGACTASSNFAVNITLAPDATFSYAGSPYCENGGTASVTYGAGASGGAFTASPAGLSINSGTGEIDLNTSTPGTYTVDNDIAASGGCAAANASTSVTIDPAEDATYLFSSTAECQGGTDITATITGTGGGAFSALPAGLSLSSATGDIDVSASAPGVYTVTYTTVGTCSDFFDIVVTISLDEDATYSYSSTTECQSGTDMTATITGTGGGTFTATPAGLTINATTGKIDVSTSTASTYDVTYTTPGTCSVSSIVSITIDADDDPSFSYSAGTYCLTETDPIPTITGTAGGNFSATGGLTINIVTGEIDLDVSGIGAYSVTYTTGGVCPTSSNAAINITTAPDATFSYSGTPYCENGGTAVVTFGGGASSGVFSILPAGSGLNSSTGDIDLSLLPPGGYTVSNDIAASGGCAAANATAPITITALDDAGISYSSTGYCQLDADPIPTINTGGGVFTSTPAGLILDGATGEIDVSVSTTGTYTVTYTTAGACPNSSNASITISADDDATYTFSSVSECQNGTDITATITGTPGGIFTSSPAGLILDGPTGTIDVSASTGGLYTVTYTTTGTCPATLDVSITITDNDDATFNYPSSSYCQADVDPTPTITGGPGGAFTSSPTGLVVDGVSGLVDLSASTIGTYTITYTTVGPCITSTNVTLGVTSIDDAAFSYTATSYCVGSGTETPTITGTTGGGFAATPAGSGIDPVTGLIDLATATPGVYDITYTTVGACSASSMVAITLITTPIISAVADSVVCGTFTLPIIGGTGLSGSESYYDASGGSGLAFAAGSSITNSMTLFIYDASSTCSDETSFIITINATPTSSGAGIDQTICDTIDLVTLGGNNPAVGIGLWTVVSGSGAFVDDADGATDVSGLTIGANEYMWTISNGSCASSSANVIITMDECLATSPVDLVIPSGFTPDGDLVNDDWELIGIDQYPDCQVEIFNKWGNSIFTSTGYTTAWDGTVNGSPLPVGAFYYIIVLNDGSSDPLKGTVTIIK